MTTFKRAITDPTVRIKPSEDLYKYISKITNYSGSIPPGISSILNKSKEVSSKHNITPKYLLSSKDYMKIASYENSIPEGKPNLNGSRKKKKVVDKILRIEDLRWLYEYIKEENSKSSVKVFLHELVDGSDILLPENEEVPRNPELEKRCQHLKIQQENQRYMNMTKNVDNIRRRLPEDTLSYQIKEMNKQMIAIVQFIISVLAGFAFGFIGIEVFVGTLDFGFRLLLGVICALIIALAELYFLAKKLNEVYMEEAPNNIEDKMKLD